jgi:hypothetical protein
VVAVQLRGIRRSRHYCRWGLLVAAKLSWRSRHPDERGVRSKIEILNEGNSKERSSVQQGCAPRLNSSHAKGSQ